PRARGGGEVVVNAARVAPERDALHRVGQVAVERREEAEAVLARQVAPPVAPGARDEDAARLATRPGRRLVDRDLEPALGELVGVGEAANAAPQDGDPACPAGLHGPTRSNPRASGNAWRRASSTRPRGSVLSGKRCRDAAAVSDA